MKLLIISNYGSYHTARPEANIFIGLALKGFDIHIMSVENDFEEDFKKAGITFVNFHPKSKNDKSEIKFIRDYIIDKQIDVIHLFNSKSSVAGIKASKNIDVKVVLYRGYLGNINWWDPFAYRKYLHPRVDKIVCNSIGVERYLKKQLLFEKDKAVAVNKGHDVNWYKDYKAIDIKSELGIPKDALLLINVANNRSMKGIPYLLKAMTLLPKDKEIHLLLAGRGMDSKSNIKLIKKAGIENKIHFLGYRKDVLNIVSASDVFVSSSIKGESITKSIIESMALKVAPIITDIAGNIELVDNNINGLVVQSKSSKQLAEAIMKIYDNPELIEKFGAESYLRIKNVLNTQNTIDGYAEVYKGLQ